MGFCLYNNAIAVAPRSSTWRRATPRPPPLRAAAAEEEEAGARGERFIAVAVDVRVVVIVQFELEATAGVSVTGALFGQGQGKLRSRPSFRVMILDWDVHHGNGTQAMFEDDPTVSWGVEESIK